VSRRRYHYDASVDKVVEVSPDYMGEGYSAGGHTSEGEIYDGARTIDGVDISSRKKRADYMKATGTTDPQDYASHWVKNKERIERARQGDFDHRGRREALGRAAYAVESAQRGRR
jgi:hypothetical protein